MIQTTSPTKTLGRLALMAAFTLICLTGCLPMDGGQGADDGHAPPVASGATSAPAGPASAEPYSPADFSDLLIPGELEWRRDKSLSINTESFTGGVLNFTGRVEVNSLTEFFLNGMKKDGWTVIGTVKSENVLMAFIKEKTSCLIKIDDGGTLSKTEVNIYTTRKNN